MAGKVSFIFRPSNCPVHKIGSDQTAQNFSINFGGQLSYEAFFIWWFTNKINFINIVLLLPACRGKTKIQII